MRVALLRREPECVRIHVSPRMAAEFFFSLSAGFPARSNGTVASCVVQCVTDVGQRRTVNQDSFHVKQTTDDRLCGCSRDLNGRRGRGLEASSTAAGTLRLSPRRSLKAWCSSRRRKAERLLRRASMRLDRSGLRKEQRKTKCSPAWERRRRRACERRRHNAVNVGDSRFHLTLRRREHHSGDTRSLYDSALVDIGNISEDEARLNRNRNIPPKGRSAHHPRLSGILYHLYRRDGEGVYASL